MKTLKSLLMNPKHAKHLESAIHKFGLLEYRQIFDLLTGEIKGCTVNRCISKLIRDKLIISNRSSLSRKTIYTHWSEEAIEFPNRSLSKYYSQSPAELPHRISCTDVYIALARRSHVSEITSEHEMKHLKMESPVIGRRPDGLFTLSREDRLPIIIAIEVETSLRNRKRINEVISCYVDTYNKDPTGLRGVLIVAVTENIARAYRDAIEEIGKQHPKRFIVSERLDLSDVKETILGRSSFPLCESVNEHFKKWISTCPSKPFKAERTPSPPITGYTCRDSDSGFGIRSKI